MNIGYIKWFNEEQGYGVISSLLYSSTNNNDVFLHIKNWDDNRAFDQYSETPFVFETTLERQKISAVKCRYFKATKANWSFLFSQLGENETIVLNKSKRSIEFNFIRSTLYSLKEDFDKNVLIACIFERLKCYEKEELVSKAATLFEVRKETENVKLKLILDEVFSTCLRHVDITILLDLWRKDFIPITAMPEGSFQKLHGLITVEDLKKIKNQSENEETSNLIILQLLRNLQSNYQYDNYKAFEEIIALIDSSGFKAKIIKDLHEVGAVKSLEYFNGELIKIGIIESAKQLREIDVIKTSLPTFLSIEIGQKINAAAESYILSNSTHTGLFEACIRKYVSEPENKIRKDAYSLTLSSFHKLLRFKDSFYNGFIDELLELLVIDNSKHELIYDIAKSLNNQDVYNKLDSVIYNQVEEKDYFKYWKQGVGKHFPKFFLLDYLDDTSAKYEQIHTWLSSNFGSKLSFTEILFTKLSDFPSINNRVEFYTVYYCIKTLSEIDNNNISKIIKQNNEFQILILWHLKFVNTLNFDILKGKFIYFKPSEQVDIFKRLFYLKHIGQIDFDINRLDEIVRADLDLYLANEQFNNDFVLDISTHVIIECIKSFEATNSFVFESDYILKDLQRNKSRKFKIGEYFDLCLGRQIANFDKKKSKGAIERVLKVINGKKYDYYEVRCKFDPIIVSDIKNLKKRRYYEKDKVWGVSLTCEKDLFILAVKHSLFIKLPDGKHYSNNTHLVEYCRDLVPTGITFCEGRKANIPHKLYNTEFWNCTNQDCFQNCVVPHYTDDKLTLENEPWKYYTLYDFLKILNLNIDEITKFGFIKDGHYYKFLGHINAFNRLLDHLYCEKCNNLLYPEQISHFALYTDVRFKCIDDNCTEKLKVIYLNHCLYGECKTIIDSRISKQCHHNLYICPNCGSCCSEKFFERKLERLKHVGGYIHPELIKNVEEQNGHLEKQEYYCYKCEDMMTPRTDSTFKCKNCQIIYDFNKFKWVDRKWTEIHRRRKDYPAMEAPVEEEKGGEDGLPF